MKLKTVWATVTGLSKKAKPTDEESGFQEPNVYPGRAMIAYEVFPLLEMEWKHIQQYLGTKPDVDSLPYDIIKCQIDFTRFPGNLDALNVNPSLRIRKGNKTVLVPARVAVPKADIHVVQVKKLSLAHIQHQFQFNFMTTPLINWLPFPIVSAVFLSLSYRRFGTEFLSTEEFLPGLAIAVSVATLLTVIWTQLVDHSERNHDAKCRRLENDLIVYQLEQLRGQRRPSGENLPVGDPD